MYSLGLRRRLMNGSNINRYRRELAASLGAKNSNDERSGHCASAAAASITFARSVTGSEPRTS